jgi:hypothetical protein
MIQTLVSGRALSLLCCLSLCVISWLPPLATAQPSSSKAPDVDSAEFQGAIDKAWEEAKAGKSSHKACTGIKGSVHGRIRYSKEKGVLEKATRAIQVCEHEIPVRYFETYLNQVVAGEKSCRDFMSQFQVEMGAIGLRMATFEQIEPRHTKELILKSLAERIRQDCPDIAPWMLPRGGGRE